MLSQTQIKTLSQLGLPNWQLRVNNQEQPLSYYRLDPLLLCCATGLDVNKPQWAHDLALATDASFVSMSASAAAHWPEHLRVTFDAAACSHTGVLSAKLKQQIWRALTRTTDHDR